MTTESDYFSDRRQLIGFDEDPTILEQHQQAMEVEVEVEVEEDQPWRDTSPSTPRAQRQPRRLNQPFDLNDEEAAAPPRTPLRQQGSPSSTEHPWEENSDRASTTTVTAPPPHSSPRGSPTGTPAKSNPSSSPSRDRRRKSRPWRVDVLLKTSTAAPKPSRGVESSSSSWKQQMQERKQIFQMSGVTVPEQEDEPDTFPEFDSINQAPSKDKVRKAGGESLLESISADNVSRQSDDASTGAVIGTRASPDTTEAPSGTPQRPIIVFAAVTTLEKDREDDEESQPGIIELTNDVAGRTAIVVDRELSFDSSSSHSRRRPRPVVANPTFIQDLRDLDSGDEDNIDVDQPRHAVAGEVAANSNSNSAFRPLNDDTHRKETVVRMEAQVGHVTWPTLQSNTEGEASSSSTRDEHDEYGVLKETNLIEDLNLILNPFPQEGHSIESMGRGYDDLSPTSAVIANLKATQKELEDHCEISFRDRSFVSQQKEEDVLSIASKSTQRTGNTALTPAPSPTRLKESVSNSRKSMLEDLRSSLKKVVDETHDDKYTIIAYGRHDPYADHEPPSLSDKKGLVQQRVQRKYLLEELNVTVSNLFVLDHHVVEAPLGKILAVTTAGTEEDVPGDTTKGAIEGHPESTQEETVFPVGEAHTPSEQEVESHSSLPLQAQEAVSEVQENTAFPIISAIADTLAAEPVEPVAPDEAGREAIPSEDGTRRMADEGPSEAVDTEVDDAAEPIAPTAIENQQAQGEATHVICVDEAKTNIDVEPPISAIERSPVKETNEEEKVDQNIDSSDAGGSLENFASPTLAGNWGTHEEPVPGESSRQSSLTLGEVLSDAQQTVFSPTPSVDRIALTSKLEKVEPPIGVDGNLCVSERSLVREAGTEDESPKPGKKKKANKWKERLAKKKDAQKRDSDISTTTQDKSSRPEAQAASTESLSSKLSLPPKSPTNILSPNPVVTIGVVEPGLRIQVPAEIDGSKSSLNSPAISTVDSELSATEDISPGAMGRKGRRISMKGQKWMKRLASKRGSKSLDDGPQNFIVSPTTTEDANHVEVDINAVSSPPILSGKAVNPVSSMPVQTQLEAPIASPVPIEDEPQSNLQVIAESDSLAQMQAGADRDAQSTTTEPQPPKKAPNDLRNSFMAFDALLQQRRGVQSNIRTADDDYTEYTMDDSIQHFAPSKVPTLLTGQEGSRNEMIRDRASAFEEEAMGHSYMEYTVDETINDSNFGSVPDQSARPLHMNTTGLLSSRMFSAPKVAKEPTITIEHIADDDMTQLTFDQSYIEPRKVSEELPPAGDATNTTVPDSSAKSTTKPMDSSVKSIKKETTSMTGGSQHGSRKRDSLSGSHRSLGSKCGSSTGSDKVNKRISDILRKDIWNQEAATVERALANLIEEASCGRKQRSKICQFGGVMAIIRAMEGHLQLVPIQLAACTALERLAMDPETQVVIGEMGGIVAIVEAMKTSEANKDMQEAGCSALANISRHRGTTDEADGAVQALCTSMSRHPTNMIVQAKAFGAIANLCMDNEDRLKELSDAGGMLAMTIALQKPWPSKSEKYAAISSLSILLRCLAEQEEDADVEEEPYPNEAESSYEGGDMGETMSAVSGLDDATAKPEGTKERITPEEAPAETATSDELQPKASEEDQNSSQPGVLAAASEATSQVEGRAKAALQSLVFEQASTSTQPTETTLPVREGEIDEDNCVVS